jgi:hypothetical protein
LNTNVASAVGNPNVVGATGSTSEVAQDGVTALNSQRGSSIGSDCRVVAASCQSVQRIETSSNVANT